VASRERFFHWELEFPEAFFDSAGAPLEHSGFDAVLGNPPWDTLRRSQEDDQHDASPRLLTRFTRDSGCYHLQSEGHANLYQLFTERALQLLKPAGRFGLLLPSGLFSDHGCVRLRRELLEQCRIDGVLSFDNREAMFPIHRGVRFVLVTGSTGQPMTEVPTISGLHSAAALEDVPDAGPIPGAVMLPVSLIRRFSGETLAMPELRHDHDRRLLAAILFSSGPLGSADGWNCRFGRELNATDDRVHFGTHGLPILEGKQIEPFRVNVEQASARIARATARRLLGSRAAFDRPRLGYREVAASTNRLTLIAAMIPEGTVTTHTIFCLKERLDTDVQWFLCGMFNSFVANYLVRLHGGTHVTASIVSSLPMPRPARDSTAFVRVTTLARALADANDMTDAYIELQALAARLYGCSSADFAHVLDTFPLIERHVRDACRTAFDRLESVGSPC